MIANLNNHIFTTRRIELTALSGEVELTHDTIPYWLGLLIDADEIYDYLSCHDAIIT